MLISQNADDVRRIIGESGTKLIEKCCGGGCCMSVTKQDSLTFEKVPLPDNDAYRSLQLKVGPIPTTLSGIVDLPHKIVSLLPERRKSIVKAPSPVDSAISFSIQNEQSIDFTPHSTKPEITQPNTTLHPPNFVQPHPPYNVYSAKIFSVRELTRAGAEKR
jgi:hypothetical protein